MDVIREHRDDVVRCPHMIKHRRVRLTRAVTALVGRRDKGAAQFATNQATFVFAVTAMLRWMANDPGDPVTIFLLLPGARV